MKKIVFFVCAFFLMMACSHKATNNGVPAADAETEVAETDAPQYIDLALPGIGDNIVKVSDYVGKNKLVLIDFWASWCPPCRAEMPTVVRTYTDFHPKGLEVVGVSLDNNKDAWVKAVSELNMSWPQMSDLRGWDCEGAQVYNVRSIPANVLVDQHGRVIAKDLRGDDLYNKVAELLK